MDLVKDFIGSSIPLAPVAIADPGSEEVPDVADTSKGLVFENVESCNICPMEAQEVPDVCLLINCFFLLFRNC